MQFKCNKKMIRSLRSILTLKLCCRMTISASNNLGGQKTGDSAYSYKGISYGFGTQFFSGDAATKQAKFQFDFKRPTHCLLENHVADVISGKTNCTVFPISLGGQQTGNDSSKKDDALDIRTVLSCVCYVAYAFYTTCTND